MQFLKFLFIYKTKTNLKKFSFIVGDFKNNSWPQKI